MLAKGEGYARLDARSLTRQAFALEMAYDLLNDDLAFEMPGASAIQLKFQNIL